MSPLSFGTLGAQRQPSPGCADLKSLTSLKHRIYVKYWTSWPPSTRRHCRGSGSALTPRPRCSLFSAKTTNVCCFPKRRLPSSCGAFPIPACHGLSHPAKPSRGGHREANAALTQAAISPDKLPPTDYFRRRSLSQRRGDDQAGNYPVPQAVPCPKGQYFQRAMSPRSCLRSGLRPLMTAILRRIGQPPQSRNHLSQP